jgi:two-component system, cell cycle response regulator DivK
MARLLLIDDNEMNLDMLSRRLKLRGHSVVCATNGVQGIAMAYQEHPDLILMDMNMPQMSGWDATKQLRDAPLTTKIPVVAVTSHAMKGDQERALAVGCKGFVSKPVDFDKLESVIQALLQGATK